MKQEKYLRSLLLLVEQFENDEKYNDYLVKLLEKLFVHIEKHENLIYSEKFGKFINSLKKR